MQRIRSCFLWMLIVLIPMPTSEPADAVPPAADDVVKKGAGMLSAQALRWSWRMLIPTFGLTLIYINIHFIGRYIAQSRMFSDFGQALRLGGGGQTAKMPGGLAMVYAEIIVLFLLDGLIAGALLLAAVLLMLILDALNSWIGTLFSWAPWLANVFL